MFECDTCCKKFKSKPLSKTRMCMVLWCYETFILNTFINHLNSKA